MLRHLTSKIKATGPITVAEYMREVLTNPVTVSLTCLHPHPDLNMNKNDVCNYKKGFSGHPCVWPLEGDRDGGSHLALSMVLLSCL